MAFDYTVFSRSADKILTKFGTTAILTRKSSATYNPATSSASVITSTDVVTAIAFPYPEKLIDGTMILQGDLQVFLSASTVVNPPEPADKLTYLGIDYIVVSSKNYNPTGNPTLYELQVRK